MLAEALKAVAVAADSKFELLAERHDALLERVQAIENEGILNRFNDLMERVARLEDQPAGADVTRERLVNLLDKLLAAVDTGGLPPAPRNSAQDDGEFNKPAISPAQKDAPASAVHGEIESQEVVATVGEAPASPPPDEDEQPRIPDDWYPPPPAPVNLPFIPRAPIASVNGEIVTGPRGEIITTKGNVRMIRLLLEGPKTIRSLAESDSVTGERVALIKLTNLRRPLNDIGLDFKTRDGMWSLVEGSR